MKKWILTDTFDFHSKDAHYWEFDDFMEAKRTGESLVNSIGVNYLCGYCNNKKTRNQQKVDNLLTVTRAVTYCSPICHNLLSPQRIYH